MSQSSLPGDGSSQPLMMSRHFSWIEKEDILAVSAMQDMWEKMRGKECKNVSLELMLGEKLQNFVGDFDEDDDQKIGKTEWHFLCVHIKQQLANRLMEANAIRGLEFGALLSKGSNDKTEDAWRKMTANWQQTRKLISKVLPALSDNHVLVKCLFDSLVCAIPVEMWKTKQCPPELGKGLRRMMLNGSLASQNTMVIKFHAEEFPAPKKLVFPSQEGWFPYEAEKCDYAMTIADLLDDNETLFDVIAFIGTSLTNNEDVMDNLLVNAMLRQGWQQVQFFFYVGLFMDLVFITLLVVVALDAREAKVPSWGTLVVFWFLTFCTGFEISSEVVTEFWRAFNEDKSKQKCHKCCHALKTAMVKSFSRSYFAAFDWCVCIYQCVLVSLATTWGYQEGFYLVHAKHSTALKHHPVWHAFLMGVKTQQVTIKLLAIRRIGENVLPAYRSVFNVISGTFLGFLIIQVFNSFLVYYTIPVDVFDEENAAPWYKFWENILMTYVTMFRLDISGDFDLGDLDGKNQKIENHEINNAEEDQHHHHGIIFMYMFFATFIGIGWLNILIGLLSERYTLFYKMRLKVFEAFRVVYTYQCLCIVYTLRRWFPCCSWQCKINPNHHQVAWLKYKRSMFPIITKKKIIVEATEDGFLRRLDDEKEAYVGREKLTQKQNTFVLGDEEEKLIETIKKKNPLYNVDA